MNLSRRDFLKALGITVVASTVGLPATAAAPVVVIPIDDSVLDAPVTYETPFAWVDIAGKRHAAEYLELNNFTNWDYTNLDGQPTRIVEIVGTFREDIPTGINIVPITISVNKGEQSVVRGSGYVNQYYKASTYQEFENTVILRLRETMAAP